MVLSQCVVIVLAKIYREFVNKHKGEKMRIGTKSLLFGVHQFILHPFFVLWAWWIIYKKFPCLHELCAIITHDWGYWGLPNMDGAEGETHPERSADMWYRLKKIPLFALSVRYEIRAHSRFNAARHGIPLSKLFRADKLAVALYPTWLYLLLANLSGEIKEYIKIAKDKEGKYIDLLVGATTQTQWVLEIKAHMIMMGLKGEGYEPVRKQMEGEK